ncbi:autotransporter assembly complex protein TamA [Taklimakanibacter deserti]|uniref:autotransporter assembly complex protein TamA n=1 Tax=Taklimakanibacter deserti TaxID=2267839 RepID=UPI0013C4F72E
MDSGFAGGFWVMGIAAAMFSVLTATPVASKTVLDDIFSWFGGEETDEPVADALAYRVSIRVDHAESDLKSQIEEGSSLVTLQDKAAPGAAGLVQRALADYEGITAILYENGYYAGETSIRIAGVPVDDMRVFDAAEKARRKGAVPVDISVDVGPQFRFGKVRILDAKTHRPMPDVPDIEDSDLIEGEVARSPAIAGAERIIVNDLRHKGHPFAKIASKDVAADHNTLRLDVTLFVDAGPRAGFGRFQVSGTEGLDPEFVVSRIDVEEGEPYSPKRLEKLRKRLTSYPIIGGVRLKEAEQLDSSGLLPVDVEVSERKPRYFGFGTKYSSTDGTAANAYWGHRNLFGGAETLRIDGQVSWFGGEPDAVPDADPFGYALTVSFGKPGIFSVDDDLISEAAILREVTDAYVRDAVTLTAGVRHRFDDHLSVQVGVDFEQAFVEDSFGKRDDFVAGIPVDVIYDSTDSLLDPTEGIRASARVEPFVFLGEAGAGPVLAKGSLSGYQALDERDRFIVAGRVAGGSLVGADITDVPPARRFYAGGGGSIRGYEYQSVSPRNSNGDIIGGLSFFEASAELRVKVTDTIGVVPFFDMGAAFEDEVPDFSGLRYAAGLGLRYYTSIGPIRLDAAIPLNPRSDDDGYGIYVSIGQAF